ncbi:MAG: hypothetical protein DELT_01167 [Desulfovibrio sp.]
MKVIQRTITAPTDRKLQIDLPESVPVGQEMILVLIPY